MVKGITGTLFGEKAQPERSMSGLTELLSQFPELREVGQDVISRGRGLADRTDIFTPAQIAQLSGLEKQGLAGLGNIGLISDRQPFKPQFRFGQRASEAFEGARGLFDQVSPALQRAGGLIDRGVDPITGEEIQTGISDFLNPFTQQVIDPAAREAREAGLGLLSDIAGQATGAGAFGGQRQALLETQVPELVTQQVGDISGRLRSQGFESAAEKAMRRLTGGRERFLQGAGLGIQQAGQFAGAGAGLGNLGTQLFQARQGVQDILSQQAQDQITRSQAQLSAGRLPRALQQAGFGRETAIGQIPLQQLQMLQGIISGFPSGSGSIGARAGTSGLLSSGGDKVGAFRNILSLFGGGF